MKDILNNYGKKTDTNKGKVITLVIKAVTGVLGTSLVLENNHPYITLTVLVIGAVANELTSIYNWK